MMATLRMPTSAKWVDYCIEEPIGVGILRSRLGSRDNLNKLERYSLFDGPFETIALTGAMTIKKWIRFG